MLKVDSTPPYVHEKLARAQINLTAVFRGCGEARLTLPMEISLPADPLQWSKREAQNWLCWLREENDLDELDITHFNTNGAGLCNLSNDQIEMRLGRRAGTIFRSTLTLLQSTASLMKSPVVLPLPGTKHYPEHPVYRQSMYPVTPSFGRSAVLTDVARPQPVAEIYVENSGDNSPNKQDMSPVDSHDEEEDRAFNQFFPLQDVTITPREGRPMSNGIDCGRQGVTLWQFILELLADDDCCNIVCWTDVLLEFKVMNSKEMARRWGARKNRPKMNYDKLSRALRYYYRKNLIQHVPGKRQVYFFVEHPESLDFTQMLNTALRTHPQRRRAASAFSHVGNTQQSSVVTAGIKRLNTPPTIEMDIKKAKEMDTSPPTMVTSYSPTMVNSYASSPLVTNQMSPASPNLLYQDNITPEVDVARQLDYHRLAVAALVSSGFKMPLHTAIPSPRHTAIPSPPSLSPQSPRLQVQSPQLQVQSPRLQVQSPRLQVQSPRLQVQSPRLQVQSPRLQVQSPRLQVQSPRLQVQSPRLPMTQSPRLSMIQSLPTKSMQIPQQTVTTVIQKGQQPPAPLGRLAQ